METKDRAEFDEQMRILCARFDKPCTEDRQTAYFKALAKMPLALFVRVCEHVIADEERFKLPGPHEFWPLSRELRARAAPKPQEVDKFKGDGWDICANLRLLKHVVRRLSARGHSQDYGETGICPLRWSPEFEESTNILVRHKNAWAADMREWNLDQETGEIKPGIPPESEQTRTWKLAMEAAEKEITAHRKRVANDSPMITA